MNLTIGSQAPQFTLKDQNSKSHSLSDYLGKWLLLYFYPRDSFLIDPSGKLVKIYRKVSSAKHMSMILEDFEKFS